MFGGLPDALLSVLSMLFVGAAIKMMDDHLDAEYDICQGHQTLVVRLGRAALPYALAFSVIGTYIRPELALAMFLGSYAVGMFAGWQEKLPSKAPAVVEILLAIAVSVVLVGWQLALWAIALMAVFDWVDDLVDITTDRQSGQRNIAVRLGLVEATLLTFAALCTSVLTNPLNTALGFLAFALLTALSELTTRSLWQAIDDEDGGMSP